MSSPLLLRFGNQAANEAPAPSPARGILLPLPGIGSAPQTSDQQVVRAVAAAVAITHTADCLTLAGEAKRDGFDAGVRLTAIVQADLDVVVAEVVRVRANRSGIAPDQEQRAVAAAVGADPVLVAAACTKLRDKDNIGLAAREWIATSDPALLERAARAAAQREFLNQGPTTTDVKALRALIDAQDERIKKLENAPKNKKAAAKKVPGKKVPGKKAGKKVTTTTTTTTAPTTTSGG